MGKYVADGEMTISMRKEFEGAEEEFLSKFHELGFVKLTLQAEDYEGVIHTIEVDPTADWNWTSVYERDDPDGGY